MLKRLFTILIGVLCLVSCQDNKNDLVRFKANFDIEGTISVPVQFSLGDLYTDDLEGNAVLYKKTATGRVEIPFQPIPDSQSIRFTTVPEKEAEYSLQQKENVPSTDVQSKKEQGGLTLALGNGGRLDYRYGMTYPPEGVDSVYRKSGYIHPVITPSGDTLSRIQPPDHYHHYGIWGPWTHTQISGQQVDFWNLGDRKGTVLFKEFKEVISGPVFGSFTAAQEHIDLLTEEEPQLALNENLTVTLWDLGRNDRYMFDYQSSFSSPLENGILFEAYRYGGGIGMRFNERWKADNCSVLTSEGNDRLTADGTSARWCIVTGASSDGESTNGILFMSHKDNRMHPEPMRIWPIDGNGGRGDMFFEFCPIRHKEWNIEPNKEYQLKYRMVVFEGELKPEEAEAYWQSFANEPQIEILNNK